MELSKLFDPSEVTVTAVHEPVCRDDVDREYEQSTREREKLPKTRHYFRCPDCLSVVVFDTSVAPRPLGLAHWSTVARPVIPALTCGVCAVAMEHMGHVQANRLVLETERDACDARCLGARGPQCSCTCQGENHGAGLLVIVSTRDAGGVPMALPVDPVKATAARDTWRALVAEPWLPALNAAYPELAEKAAGKYVQSWARYLEGDALRKRRSAILAQRSPARVKALRTWLERLAVKVVTLGKSKEENGS